MRAGGVSAEGNLWARADSTWTRIVEEAGMAKCIRLIFAYPALVVSNAGALFTVQMLAILLKLNLKFFSEAFRMPAAKLHDCYWLRRSPAEMCLFPSVRVHQTA